MSLLITLLEGRFSRPRDTTGRSVGTLPWVFRHFPHPKGCERRTLRPPDVTVLGFCPHTYCVGVTSQRDSRLQTRKLRHSSLQPCLLPKFKPRAVGPPAPVGPRAPLQVTVSWGIGRPAPQAGSSRPGEPAPHGDSLSASGLICSCFCGLKENWLVPPGLTSWDPTPSKVARGTQHLREMLFFPLSVFHHS